MAEQFAAKGIKVVVLDISLPKGSLRKALMHVKVS